LECAKLIYQSGIGHILYRSAYRDSSGITFLEKSGVKVNQI
jgi:dCMP deaminase